MHKLLVICGPTAAGKTEYALRVAEQWQIPILNADSRQIYRDLPIGTAAPTPDELCRAKHYFVGTHALTETYNAGMFERDAMAVIRELIAERETYSPTNPFTHSPERPIAILSGGSMLYIEGVCKGLDDIPSVPDNLRREVQQRMYVTNDDGSFVFDRMGRVVNRLSSPTPEDPSITLIEKLVNEVYAYKSLQP